MKKILSCILVLVMLLAMVTACGNRDNNQNDDTPTLTEAVNYFHNIYKDKSASTVTDFDVVGQVMLKGVRFTVTWTSSDDRVTIKESSTSGFYTVDLPDVNDAEFSYTLTATISDPDGNSEQKSYTFNMLAVDNSAVVTEPVANVAYKIFLVQSSYGQRLFALNTTQNNENKFINTSNNPKTAADFYAEAAEGGYKFSTEIDGVKNYLYAKTTVDESTGKVSKYIGYSATESTVFTYNSSIGGVWTTLIGGVSYGVGTYGSYKTICLSEATYYSTSTVGTTQFVMSLMTSEYAETLAPEEEVVVTEPANGSTLTIPEANELGEKFAHDLYTKGKFYVTGTVKNIESTQYGNMYIEDENGNTLYVYGVYDADGTNRYDAMDPQPAVGDTVKLYGIIGYYTDKAQMKNACLVELNGEAIGGGTQGGETSDAPVAGTAYKFGMVQGNLNNNIYYLAGGMDGYYLATTTDASAALDVYLEATDGGYYLYCYVNSVKTYINMVVSDTHVNGAYEATASTVYTYDVDSKTLIASITVGDSTGDYWFGTRNDKEYTTIGPCNVTYDGFYCLFYTSEGGGDVGGGDVGGDETPDPNPSNDIVFDFGANGTAGTHTDGNDIGTEKTYTSGSYELVLTDAYKAYDGGFDMAGNSILKFGTGSVAGTVTFVVPDDVKSVIIYAARYKSYTDNNIIVVNGTSYNLTKNSDDGEYEAITVDTTTNKTVTVASSTAAAKPRCVVDKIVWVIGEGSGETPVDPAPHEHNFVNGECECGEKDPNYVPPTVESTYPVVNELHNGDKIIIGAPAYNKLLSMVKVATYYNKGVDYTLTNFSNVTNDEIFVVTVNEDGTYEFVSVSGQVLAIGTYSSLDVTGANTTWTIEPKAGADGIFYLKNVGRGNYLEWYASMDNWSTYNGSLSDMFELSFYLVEAGETTEPPAHEHNFVNGECECGEKDPNYVAPHEHNFVNGECECGEKDPNYVAPDPVETITIAEAIEIAKAQGDAYTADKYYITGIITNISNTFYGNFYITDGNGNELYVYGLKDSTGAGNFAALDPQPAVGDTITVYTVLGCYQSAPQAKDAWLNELVKHTEHTWADATCKVAKTCTICGKVEGEPLDHTYVDGSCTGCGKAEPAQGNIVTSTEDFAGLTQTGSYETRTTTSGWTAENAAVLVGGTTDANPVFKFIGSDNTTRAITLNGKTSAAGKLTSATLQNGISKLSFSYGNAFTEANGVDVTINIIQNGEVVATTRLDNDAVTQKTAYQFVWELDHAVEGEFVIEIVNNSPSNNSSSNKDRISIFNLSWDSAPIVEA